MKESLWLSKLNEKDFEHLLIFVDKNIHKFSKLTIKELIKEFKRRKMFTPDRYGGLAVLTSSFLLKKRSQRLLSKKKKFLYSVEDLKRIFDIELEETKKFKPEKKRTEIDYIEELRDMTFLIPRKRGKRLDIIDLYPTPNPNILVVLNKMLDAQELTPFKNFIKNQDLTKEDLKMLIYFISYHYSRSEIIIISKEKEGFINLQDSYVRGI